MPKRESEIQQAIIEAIEYFFTAPEYGFEIPRKDMRIIAPTPGAQAKTLQDFGRKPYDIGFYAINTTVVFLEVKARHKSGKISEFKQTQCDMLSTIAENGVEIPYGYNAWDFTWETRLHPSEVLKQAHVRRAKDMCTPIAINPIAPAVELQVYLSNATSSTSQTLAELLDRDIRQIDSLNSMPLMILANMDSSENKVLIDRPAKNTLKLMKILFNLPEAERATALSNFATSKKYHNLTSVAQAIFDMKDSWMLSNSKSLKP